MIFITAASLTGLGIYGINGYKKLKDNTRTLYADRVVCMRQLASIRFQYAGEILPAALKVKTHLLTYDAAQQRIRNAGTIIDSNWHNYKLTYLTPKENFLARQIDTLKKQVDEESKTLESILLKKDTAALNELIQKQSVALQSPFLEKLTQLMDLQERVGNQIFESSRHSYTTAVNNFVFWIFFSILLALSLSFIIIKNIRRLIKDILESNDSVKESENKYRSILQNACDAIYVADNTGNFIDLNESMCKMLGYSKEQLMKLNFSEIIDSENLISEPIERPAVPNQPIFKERTFITAEGKKVAVEINGQRLDEDTLMGVARDVTGRKRMETELREAELKFRTLVEKSIVGVYIAQNERFIYVNPRLAEIFGYTHQELLDLPGPPMEILFTEESRKLIRTNLQARYSGEIEQSRYQVVGITKEGATNQLEIHSNMVTIDGKPSLMGTILDITERKRMETGLREAELKFRTLVEQSMVGVYISQNERYLYVNPRFAEIFGYEPQELVDQPDSVVERLFDKESLDIIRANIKARYSGDVDRVRYQISGKRKDGSRNELEIYGTIVTINGQKIIIGTMLDVTERKQAEELILKEKELSNTIIDSLPGIFYLRDMNGRGLRWNKNLELVTGYSAEEIEGSVLQNLIAEENRETMQRAVDVTLNVGYSTTETKLVTKDGSKIPYLITKKLVNYENQPCFLGIGIDISQRIKVEDELKKSEQNLAAYNRELNLLNSINDVILRNEDELELYQEVCNCIIRTGGYKLAWVCCKPDENGADQIVKPLVAAGAMDYLSDVKIDLSDPEQAKGPTGTSLQTGGTFVNNDVNNIDFFVPWAERAKKHGIQSSLSLYLDLGDGKKGALMVYSGQTNAFDKHEVYIMERLAANVSTAVQNIENRSILNESENRFRGAFENSAIGMGLVSPEGKWLKVNRSLYEMLGYTEKELLSLTFQQITHPEDLEKDLELFYQTLRGEIDTYRMEKRYFHKDGSIIWINLTVAMVRGADKQPLYVVSQIENITEKVESQLKFQNLVENFIVGVYILQNGKLVYVNPRLVEETGYREEELIGMPYEQFIYENDRDYVMNIIDSREQGLIDTVRYEARIIKKDGEPLWYEIIGSTTTYRGATALIGTMINVNIRKEAEHEVQRLSRLYHFVSRMNESVLKSETEEDIFSEACRIAVEVGKFRMAWIGLYDEKNDRITPVAWDGYDNGFLDTLDIPGMKVSESAIPSAKAIRQKAPVFYNDIANDPDIPVFIKQEMVKRDYLSGTSFPIFINGKVVAAMVLLVSEPFFFNELEIKLLQGVTDNITYAVDKITIREHQTKSEANLRSIFDSTDVAYLLLDKEYNIVALNQQMRAIYRENVGVELNEGDDLIALIRPDRQQMMRDLYDSVLHTKKPSGYESSFVDGVKRYFAASVFPIVVANEAIGICISTIDITTQKNALEKLEAANEDLQKKTKELEYSNTELEQFAYVASHDLQEPLRMVTSFMGQLEKKYGDVLDEKGKKYIYFATDGAKRMRQLILDLLEFSRVGRTEESFEEVDFNDLINEVLPLYRKNIEEFKAKVYIDQLPTMLVYKTPVRQIFQNLVGNALKYHREGVAPVIRIASTETPTAFEFSVKDNGIGIDPEYFNQIFIIFKRLHNRDQYPGTGMGLAITKKIVENMGGRIWVDSREGEGSVFHFTIPKHIKQ